MFLPQLAESTEVTSLTQFIDDDKWVAEQKLDGHRLVLRSPSDPTYPPVATTRNGTTYTRTLPKEIRDFRFPEGEWALDGELVDGTYWVFDMPASPAVGEDAELWARRAMLESFLANVKNPFRLVPQARTRDEKIRLAETSLRNNFEGLIVKRTSAAYRFGGRTAEWLKIKYVSTADCIVLDVRDDGKESVRLGLVERLASQGVPSKVVEVGRASLIGKEKAGAIKVGDVLEVRYLYTGANGRLYQPTILRKRDDKGMQECLTSQLKHVNKEVLDAL